jgi:2-iminobutanoate/2-iminopropanoate deaminase
MKCGTTITFLKNGKMAKRKIIYTDEAPDPIGPYNQAVLVGKTLYISGQIAIDPFAGVIITDNIKVEARQVMENLKAILKAANMDFSNVVKCTIFLGDMEDFNEVNQVYGSYFDDDAPARETVAVLGLPKNVHVEISAIAVR